MEKSGLYSRQGILSRKTTKTVDKNHTFQDLQEKKAVVKDQVKKQKIGAYNNYMRVNHFNTREEKKEQQIRLKAEADLQMQVKQQIRAEEKRKAQAEDRKMLSHLRMMQERDAHSHMERRARMMKVSQENKKAAIFKENITKHAKEEDNALARREEANHEHNFIHRY
uniref:Uncharacterized protein n=1 Tax=Euplotes crassus TaxID=5936 RepID=A0A7S3KBV9_EUPCR|mmetsp:Transcript_20078/g.19693  ORF Transcript_20078/g.19693 Transcript_20078/m.19693 type:complete len:167 (+) Transcript_20078:15-515(+)